MNMMEEMTLNQSDKNGRSLGSKYHYVHKKFRFRWQYIVICRENHFQQINEVVMHVGGKIRMMTNFVCFSFWARKWYFPKLLISLSYVGLVHVPNWAMLNHLILHLFQSPPETSCDVTIGIVAKQNLQLKKISEIVIIFTTQVSKKYFNKIVKKSTHTKKCKYFYLH